ncbi:CACNA1E [Symbiodinium natans]|uniref:CACNA1E protein n=1 Tax=Symbiodinium natans TaxID=878477 RepID=A0A812NGL7_9DINO|nr:CACNA1E [Symbiodinium natans]
MQESTTLRSRLEHVAMAAKAAEARPPRLRAGLKLMASSMAKEEDIARLHARNCEEVQAETLRLRHQARHLEAETQVELQATAQRARDEAHEAHWRRVFLEAQQTELNLEMRAFEQRQALQRRSEHFECLRGDKSTGP